MKRVFMIMFFSFQSMHKYSLKQSVWVGVERLPDTQSEFVVSNLEYVCVVVAQGKDSHFGKMSHLLPLPFFQSTLCF